MCCALGQINKEYVGVYDLVGAQVGTSVLGMEVVGVRVGDDFGVAKVGTSVVGLIDGIDIGFILGDAVGFIDSSNWILCTITDKSTLFRSNLLFPFSTNPGNSVL